MTPGHPSRGELEAFDRGLLRAARWQEIERHVAKCNTCCRALEDVPDDALVSLVKTAGEPGLSATIIERAFELETSVAIAPTPAPPCSEPPPELRDHPRYRVLEVLGAGGMGTVFKAEHRLMRRTVALKVIRPELLATVDGVERFRQEARAAARLAHPNIATAYDADQAGNTHFLVMEYAEGQTLDKVLEERGPLPWPLACGLVRQAAAGLQHASDRGMVHRDIKPGNLLLTGQGEIKILDFGLARLSSESAHSGGRATPVGAVVGTPLYLAPEQAREPHKADVRADLYSLGCTWYEMLTGQPPFPQGTLLQQLLAHQDQAVRPVTDFRSDVPPQMNEILLRLLAKDPARRWQTPTALLKALEPWTQPANAAAGGRQATVWRPGPRTVIAALSSALLLCLLLTVGWRWFASRSDDDEPRKAVVEGVPPGQPATELNTAPDRAPPPLPEGPSLSAQAQAIAWLAANNRFGPENPLVADNARKLTKAVTPGKVFVLELGPKLMKTAQYTVLVGRQQDFFVFEPPPGSPLILDNQAILTTSAEQNQEFQTPLPVRLANLHVDQKTIDGTSLSGSVAYRVSEPVAGKLAIRLTLMLGKRTKTSYHVLDTQSLRGDGIARFRFKSLFTEQTRPSGAIVLLLDVLAMSEPAARVRSLVLSNDVAALVVDQRVHLPKNP